MAKTYNTAGRTAWDYNNPDADPCGYLTKNPDIFITRANDALTAGLQRVTEIIENTDDPILQARAWKIYNLARLLAGQVGKSNDDIARQLGCLRVEKIIEAL